MASFIFLLFNFVVSEMELTELERNLIINKLLEDYDSSIRAKIETTLDVESNIDFEQISSINDATMDYEITIYFRMLWQDHRLG